jgi:hypothetical protein
MTTIGSARGTNMDSDVDLAPSVTSPAWRSKELKARRAIEDAGFFVHDANVLFRENCPNIDLVVFGMTSTTYVQIKSSSNPATRNGVVIDGSPWTIDQMFFGAPIFNRHAYGFKAQIVLILDAMKTGEVDYYLVQPLELEGLLRPHAREFLAKRKRNGEWRKMFRKELPRDVLSPWARKWSLLGEPCLP